MNKARLEWHREKQRSLAEYIRAKNNQAMAKWADASQGIDRDDPDALQAIADIRGQLGMKLINAVTKLDGDRREGALKRAGRLLREEHALCTRAARLRAGEKPLDEWARCRCGAAFQPGERNYTSCWGCSSQEWYKSSFSCVFCDRRHSMSFAACFVCKAEGREDAARDLRLVVNRRDDYTCAMCGVDAMETGAELQVGHIKPVELGGSSDPWNLETVCSDCSRLKGRHYEKLDEREFWRMAQIYLGPLFEYLAPDERARLLALTPDTEQERIDFGRPTHWGATNCGVTGDDDGILNVVTILDARPIDVVTTVVTIPEGPDACKGEVLYTTGAQPCRNRADHREGILCEVGCR